MRRRKYPSEFIGRCGTCLDNAYLDSAPCRTGYGQGMPLNEDECMIRRAQKCYDAAHTATKDILP